MSRGGVELDVTGAIERHFQDMEPTTRNRVMDFADQLGEMATAGLHSTLPDCLLTTPVALLDEDRMEVTLDTLEPSDPSVTELGGFAFGGSVGGTNDRYWSLLNGNTTEKGFQDQRAAFNLDPVFARLETSSNFPLSLFVEKYDPGTPICTVRADLNDAGIELYRRLCHEAGERPKDIMLANFDADTRGVLRIGHPQTYVRQLIEARRNSSATHLEVYPRLGHQEIDEERFPHMQRLIQWRDYMNSKFGFSFAAHYAVNLYGYLDCGGYDRSWDNNEQLQMGRVLAERASATGGRMESVVLDRVIATVSPRRYIIEFATGQHMGYGALTVPEDGRQVHVAPAKVEDLSGKRFKEEIGYEVARICERGLEKFMAEYQQVHPNTDFATALDAVFEKIQGLVREEAEDAPNLPGMKTAILRALADFSDEVEERKAV